MEAWLILRAMTSTRIETPASGARPLAWRGLVAVAGMALALAALETLQNWFSQRSDPYPDNLGWMIGRMLPPWLVVAALGPAIVAVCRRYALRRPSPRVLGAHVVASLAFPLLHMACLALVHRVIDTQVNVVSRFGELVAFHYVFDVLVYWIIAGLVTVVDPFDFRAATRAAPTRAAPTRAAPTMVAPTTSRRRQSFIIRTAGSVRVVPVEAVDWIEARNYCARLHTGDGRFVIRESLASIEADLDPALFARIHRSTIVRLDRIAEVRIKDGTHVVMLTNGVVIPASRTRWSALREKLRGAVLLVLLAVVPPPLSGQASRNWRPDDRALVTDLSYVTAVAATANVIYAATPNGLAIYDRGGSWRQTIGAIEGFPEGHITAMAADPGDDTAWIAMSGRWIAYEPFTRRLDSGSLPGATDQVVLDARNPSRGAWFHTSAGWYEVPRGSLAAYPARDIPPPGSRIGGMSARELQARLPAFDAVRMRVERDEQLRGFRLTSAALAPLTNEIIIGTDGNGAWRVDPMTYATTRLPAGLSGTVAGAVAHARGQICASASASTTSARHGIACFDENLSGFTYVETAGLAQLPAGLTRRLVITERAIWAVTQAGLLRAPRRGGRSVIIGSREGLPGDQVLSIAPAGEGVYVGTSEGIAFVADTGRGLAVTETARGPGVLAIAGLIEDTLWAGTTAGIVGFLLPLGGPVVRPIAMPSQAEPVVALALVNARLFGATGSHLLARDSAGWRTFDAPGPDVGRVATIVPDGETLWLAGDRGFAHFDPARNAWQALVSPADVPLPVRDIAVSRSYVWVATDAGVVRFDRRALR